MQITVREEKIPFTKVISKEGRKRGREGEEGGGGCTDRHKKGRLKRNFKMCTAFP